MSTTRPCSPGDRGPESGDGGASGVSAAGVTPVDGGAPGDAASPDGAALAPTGRQARRLDFDGESGVVPLARDFARQALYAWGWLPAASADRRAAAEDVLLVVSELVTNACLHAEGPDELRISCDNKVLRIEVSDRGAGQPAPRTPHRAGRPGGHGMFIVQRLCLDWGVVRTPGVAGKTVWAELGAPA
ncbi:MULTISPECIES: ATP-binding protein [unclassified Streptomyces]|uniref:ATP-binding protein n=1 Tax=unclassified Streptomyces TaxID=2593676 RepID=UPI002250DA66|nr:MULTISPECIES: ATP-binding protein [unclassified Streptomyces]MCX4990455.1 ATP-binding protein [Streptomyces sp. NBC_00568]MCX5004314.1 ATP-binding protein [Streptomyces sp. NBC_00638]